jgi:hypothetical protein
MDPGKTGVRIRLVPSLLPATNRYMAARTGHATQDVRGLARMAQAGQLGDSRATWATLYRKSHQDTSSSTAFMRALSPPPS